MDEEFDKLVNDINVKNKPNQEDATNGSKEHEAGTSKEKKVTFTPKKWVNKEPSNDVFDIEAVFQSEQLSTELQKCRLFPRPKTPFCSLQRIYHTANCPLPLPTNEKFKRLSLEMRSTLLFDYFTNIAKLQMQHYRKSIIRAPQPKEIPLKVINSPALSASSSKQKSEEKENVYFSRSGRQLKRKNYTENENYEPDEDAILKKNKIDTDTDDKLTFDDFCFEDYPLKVDPSQSRTPKSSKKPPSKRLFKVGTRSAKILDNAKDETEKKNALDDDMAAFERSLDDDNLVVETEASPQKVEEHFIPIRISPPLPRSRRPLRTTKPLTRQNSYTELSITETPTRRQNNLTTKLRTKSGSDTSSSENTKLPTSIMEQVSCPICNKLFNQDRIQDHASNCGLDEIEEAQPAASGPLDKLTCEICNREFLLTTKYEVHVKECIASKVINF